MKLEGRGVDAECFIKDSCKVTFRTLDVAGGVGGRGEVECFI